MGIYYHKSTACIHYVVYNVGHIVCRKLSKYFFFTKAAFVLHRLGTDNTIKPKLKDVTLAFDDNQNIHKHKMIMVAVSHVQEGFKRSTNIHTLSSI